MQFPERRIIFPFSERDVSLYAPLFLQPMNVHADLSCVKLFVRLRFVLMPYVLLLLNALVLTKPIWKRWKLALFSMLSGVRANVCVIPVRRAGLCGTRIAHSFCFFPKLFLFPAA